MTRGPRSAVLVTALFMVLALLYPAPAAAADGSRDPMAAAEAMVADPDALVSAVRASDGTGVSSTLAMMSFTGDYAGFPTGDDDSFVGLSTGDAAVMNDGTQEGYFASTTLDGMSTNLGTDLAGLTLTMDVPSGSGLVCFATDLRFMSEEFPEWVGSSFNDFVVGRINNTAPPTISGDNQPVAPGNFLVDGDGNAITVNANYNVNAGHASGTVFDGATPTLQAMAQVPEGDTFTFTVWVADAGDSIYDSMVFLDDARVFRANKCAQGTFGPSETTLTVKKSSKKVTAKGTVVPSAEGVNVKVTLYKKVDGSFKKVDSASAPLGPATDVDGDGIDEGSRYSKSFKRLHGSCKLKVKFPGDGDTYPSTATKKFKC